jgi:hypothetical protein
MNPNKGPQLNPKSSKIQIGVTANGKKKVKITALLLFKIKGGKKC